MTSGGRPVLAIFLLTGLQAVRRRREAKTKDDFFITA
jgi:hypothetical protein